MTHILTEEQKRRVRSIAPPQGLGELFDLLDTHTDREQVFDKISDMLDANDDWARVLQRLLQKIEYGRDGE